MVEVDAAVPGPDRRGGVPAADQRVRSRPAGLPRGDARRAPADHPGAHRLQPRGPGRAVPVRPGHLRGHRRSSRASPPPETVALREETRRLARASIDEVLAEHDLDAIVAPTNSAAWKTRYVETDGEADRFLFGSSGPAAVAGYPNITVPAGYVGRLPDRAVLLRHPVGRGRPAVVRLRLRGRDRGPGAAPVRADPRGVTPQSGRSAELGGPEPPEARGRGGPQQRCCWCGPSVVAAVSCARRSVGLRPELRRSGSGPAGRSRTWRSRCA